MTNDYQKNVTLEYRDPYWNLDGVSLGGRFFWSVEAGIVDYTNESYGHQPDLGFPVWWTKPLWVWCRLHHNKLGNLSDYFQIESSW